MTDTHWISGRPAHRRATTVLRASMPSGRTVAEYAIASAAVFGLLCAILL